MKLAGIVLALGIALSGCASSQAVVRTQAASDLRCDSAKLVVTPPQADDYPYIVEGCGAIGRYVVSYCSGLAGCTVTDAQIVSTSLAKQAAFDLRCTPSGITLSVLNRDTFGARGCDRQATYELTGCREGACKVIPLAVQ